MKQLIAGATAVLEAGALAAPSVWTAATRTVSVKDNGIG